MAVRAIGYLRNERGLLHARDTVDCVRGVCLHMDDAAADMALRELAMRADLHREG